MHQTFYIDIDEEITSIVDRLRKARAQEVIIVVPKRALLIQSIVNLKLLKKEADNFKKQLIIVTQDKLGKLLVEKAGIAVQQKLDEIEGEEMISPETNNINNVINVEMDDAQEEFRVKTKNRLETMGSAEYFEEASKKGSSRIGVKPEYAEEVFEKPIKLEEKIVNKELVTEIGADIKKSNVRKKSAIFDIVKNVDIQQAGVPDFSPAGGTLNNFNAADFERANEAISRKSGISYESENSKSKSGLSSNNNSFFEKERFAKTRLREAKTDYGNVNLSGKFWKYFAIFGSVVALIIIFFAAYIFLPKADIKIFVKTKSQSVDAQIKGGVAQTSIDFDSQMIPAKVISIEDQATEKYPVTGSKSAANQKAHGTITIYNEFSNNPQPLVATTRFQTADGKIFRLTKNVSVPGVTNVGSETKPGAIEADVAADEAGDAYNIDPTSFTIPGFKDSGNDKFTKIYAKSFKAMTGGGNSSTGTAKAITASDISSAKNKALADLTQSLKQKLKNSASGGLIIPDDATNIGDATYAVSNSVGEIVENFSVTVKAKASALAFNEKDLRDVLNKDIAKAGSSSDQIDENSLSLQYGKSDADFTSGTILIRVSASGKINSNIDLGNLKKGILGKSEDDFRAYLKTYPAIEKAEINYWPTFLPGKIPAYESRVNIELDNN